MAEHDPPFSTATPNGEVVSTAPTRSVVVGALLEGHFPPRDDEMTVGAGAFRASSRATAPSEALVARVKSA